MNYRTKLSANQNWKFYRGQAPVQRALDKNISVWETDYDDSSWEKIALPHTVREEALNCSGGLNYQGEAWYRRRFFIPKEYADRSLYFELEAAMQRVDAWLDGNPLGYREGGFLPMAFDLTGIEPEKEHILVLKVDNSDMADVPPGKPQGTLDFCYFGGIYRDAWLHISHPIHFTSAVHADRVASGGLFVHYRDLSAKQVTVRIDAHFENTSPKAQDVSIQMLLDEEVVYTGPVLSLNAGSEHVENVEFRINEPRLWHPYHPELYTVTARILHDGEILDEISERIGIREFSFRPDGFFINGEKLYLNGSNRHQEYPYVGFAITDNAQRRDVRLLRDTGVISIRLGHYPQDKAFMDACDEMGVLCIIPTPGWQIHPASVRFDEASYENTRRLIRMNRNHPSACLWEPILNETDYPAYFAKKQLEIVTEEMGGDAVYAGCDSHYAYASHYPLVYSHDIIPGRPRYIREYGDNWTEQFGPMLSMRRVRRGEHVSFYPGGEANMLRSAQERFEAYVWARLDENLSGAAMWAGIDHNRGYDPSEGAVGILDLQRLPKYCYYLMDAQQDINIAGAKCYIANEWTEHSPRDVSVYTNAPAVRLFLNDTEIGTLTAKESWSASHKYNNKLEGIELADYIHPPIIFKDVPWEPGILRAEAILDGRTVSAFEVQTPQSPKHLRLEPLWAGEPSWIADGSDLLIVHAFIEDQNGTTVTAAEPFITFSTTGDVSIVGDGQDWVKANPMQAEAGIATILLRAGYTAGSITLKAESEGLEDAILELSLQPSGLTYLPSPVCTAPTEKPMYRCDAQKYFSIRQDSRNEAWYGFDLARDKPAFASSQKEGLAASNINQKQMLEPWIAADNTFPQWWMVDLEQEMNVSGLMVKWYSDGLWYDYSIETSDDAQTWKSGAEGQASGQSTQPIRLNETIPARYVRINILSVSGGSPAGIYKAEVYGKKKE